MDEQVLASTRRSWHAVGELVIAGPQHRSHGTIRLRQSRAGFAGTASGVAVEGADLVWPGGRVGIDGRTCRELARSVGVEAGAPSGLYQDGCDVDIDETLALDPSAATVLADWLADGDAALRTFAADSTPVLWPEHFDMGISVGEVNYGVSLGDGIQAVPYAYVGPWMPREGPFWNAPFGAARSFRELLDVAAIAAFFTEGCERAS